MTHSITKSNGRRYTWKDHTVTLKPSHTGRWGFEIRDSWGKVVHAVEPSMTSWRAAEKRVHKILGDKR